MPVRSFLLILFLLNAAPLLADPNKEFYSATLPNGTIWIGQKSAHMPVGARKMSSTLGSLVIVPLHEESNYERVMRRGSPIKLVNKNGLTVLSGAWVSNMPNTYVHERHHTKLENTNSVGRSEDSLQSSNSGNTMISNEADKEIKAIIADVLSSEQNESLVAEARQRTISNPNDSEAWSHLGDTLKGDREGAISAYKKAVEIDSSYAIGYIRIAELLQHSGKYSESLGYLNQAESLMQSQSAPSSAFKALYFLFSEVYEKLGNLPLAAEARRKSGL